MGPELEILGQTISVDIPYTFTTRNGCHRVFWHVFLERIVYSYKTSEDIYLIQMLSSASRLALPYGTDTVQSNSNRICKKIKHLCRLQQLYGTIQIIVYGSAITCNERFQKYDASVLISENFCASFKTFVAIYYSLAV